ncbi:MAG: helix-turn-helix transcriptional regulator, partial [Thiohalomonadaceae bacterium]
MSNTALRMIEMLRMIPREPRKISTTDLREKLSDEGYDTTPRTIQRDLLTLSESFPLVCDDRSHPYGWSWARHASAQSLPGMDTATALTFTLTEQYLTEMLPKGVLKLMEPHFGQAHQVLKTTGNGMLAWRNKVRVLPRYQPLMQPKVKPDVVAVIYDALFRKQRVAVHYNPRNGEPRDYELNPQGLAFRDAVIYLVASQKEYDNVVMFALHRFTKAAL